MTALATSESKFLELVASGSRGERDPQFLDNLQSAVAAMPQVEINYEHAFCTGIYARKMLCKAGTFLIGARHKLANFFVLSKGTIAVADEFTGARILHAPHTEASGPGVKRVGYCLTDVEWTNFFPTVETDFTVLEKQLCDEKEGKCLSL